KREEQEGAIDPQLDPSGLGAQLVVVVMEQGDAFCMLMQRDSGGGGAFGGYRGGCRTGCGSVNSRKQLVVAELVGVPGELAHCRRTQRCGQHGQSPLDSVWWRWMHRVQGDRA